MIGRRVHDHQPILELAGQLLGNVVGRRHVDAAPLAGVLPGMRAEIEIELQRASDGMIVPARALFGSEGEHCVWAAGADGEFERIPVQKGPAHGDEVCVTGGLTEGQRVLLTEPAGRK